MSWYQQASDNCPAALLDLANEIVQLQPMVKEKSAEIKTRKEKLEQDMHKLNQVSVRSASGVEFRLQEREKKPSYTPALIRTAASAHFDLTEEELDNFMASIEQLREEAAEISVKLKLTAPKKKGDSEVDAMLAAMGGGGGGENPKKK